MVSGFYDYQAKGDNAKSVNLCIGSFMCESGDCNEWRTAKSTTTARILPST